MKIFESIRIAMSALAANKLRSVLTMLGIIIGVGAVIALMSIGRGVEKFVTDQFAGLGSNLLFVAGGEFGDGPPSQSSGSDPLTLTDMDALGDSTMLPNVASVSAEFAGSATVERDGKDLRVSVSGVTPSFPEVRNWSQTAGGFFTQTDFDERARVALLGADTYAELFEPDEYPVDQTIRINGLSFRVIGVMEEKGGGVRYIWLG